MGASVHPSCIDAPFAIRNHKSSRQWAHACKPHEHRLGEYLHSAADLILMHVPPHSAIQADVGPIRPPEEAECLP